MAKARSYLYVIAPHEATEVKIGRSVNPATRRGQLQCGKSEKLVVQGAWAVPSADAVRLEAAAHAALASVRIKGEVFAVNVPLACAFVEHVAAHGEADDFLRLALAKEKAERRFNALAEMPSTRGRWAKPEMVARLDDAEAEMKRLSVAFFAMDRARADKIDESQIWLDRFE